MIFLSFTAIILRVYEKQKELEATKAKAVQMELKFLKSQLNPHILFNNLNTIYAYALEQNEATPNMILELSDSLKYVLYESEKEYVPLINDLNYIDHYMHFMKIRSEGIKEVSYNKSIDNTSYQIRPLLLISLIENAFKHSDLKNRIATILIDIKVTEGILTLNCSNDIGDKEQKPEYKGIGLQNLKKRLDLLYPNKHELTVRQLKNKFNVILKLELL